MFTILKVTMITMVPTNSMVTMIKDILITMVMLAIAKLTMTSIIMDSILKSKSQTVLRLGDVCFTLHQSKKAISQLSPHFRNDFKRTIEDLNYFKIKCVHDIYWVQQ